MLAEVALRAAARLGEVRSVLDIGCGNGEHAETFRRAGKEVTTVSLCQPADRIGDFMTLRFDRRFDLIWASHVLEHQRNVGAFLDRCRDLMYDDSYLAITVPPMKDEIVGGHLALFNAGVLLYHLILAGFDCSKAAVRSYGYNVSVLVRRGSNAVLPTLWSDYGDLEALAHLFPFPVRQGFDGRIERVNWPWP